MLWSKVKAGQQYAGFSRRDANAKKKIEKQYVGAGWVKRLKVVSVGEPVAYDYETRNIGIKVEIYNPVTDELEDTRTVKGGAIYCPWDEYIQSQRGRWVANDRANHQFLEQANARFANVQDKLEELFGVQPDRISLNYDGRTAYIPSEVLFDVIERLDSFNDTLYMLNLKILQLESELENQ